MPELVDTAAMTDLRNLGLSLIVGFLIGFEREWAHKGDPGGERFAGARTFTLVAMFGGLVGLLERGAVFVAISFLIIALLTIASYWRSAKDGGHYGGTTEVAVLVTFLLGLAATSGHALIAAIGGVVVAILLSLKEEVQRVAASLTEEEIHATLRFLALSILVLPFLPDQGYGPYEALNPRDIWLMVVFISGLSFVGYWAMKLIGAQHGTLVTGIVGGLASSTATTLSLAKFAGDGSATPKAVASGIIAANVVMLVRVGLLLFAVAQQVWLAVWPVLAAGAVIGAVISFVFWRLAGREKTTGKAIDVGNPMEIKPALFFAVLLAVISLASSFGSDKFGEGGLYLIGLISGFADVDAITLTAGRQTTDGSITALVAGGAIMFAVAANMITKGVMAASIGNRKTGILVGVSLALIVVAGAVAYLLLRFVGEF